MKNRVFSFKEMLFYLLGLYTILPDYFKITGQNSALWCAAIIILIYAITSFREKIFIEKKTLLFCFIYLIIACSMHILHSELTQAIRVLIEYCVLFIIISKIIKTKDDYHKLIKIIIGFAVFEALTTYVHFFTDFNIFSLTQSANLPDFSLDSETQYRNGMIRVEGSFGHAITYAMYISICACLCLYIYNTERKKTYLLYYFMCVLSLLMSISRMPIIVFLASQIIYLLLLNRKKSVIIIMKVLMILITTVSIIYAVFPELFSVLLNIMELVADVFSKKGLSGLTSFESESAFTYRAEMIRVLPELIKESPLFGIGGSNYRSSSFYFLINGTKQTSIDNEYFHHLLLYGFWGLFGLLWWIFGPLILDKVKIDKTNKELSFNLYKILIIFIYSVNLFSAALMFEYKLIIVLFAIFFAEIKIRNKEGVYYEKAYYISSNT